MSRIYEILWIGRMDFEQDFEDFMVDQDGFQDLFGFLIFNEYFIYFQ
jgi:hypothetical protein